MLILQDLARFLQQGRSCKFLHDVVIIEKACKSRLILLDLVRNVDH